MVAAAAEAEAWPDDRFFAMGTLLGPGGGGFVAVGSRPNGRALSCRGAARELLVAEDLASGVAAVASPRQPVTICGEIGEKLEGRP